MVAGLTDGRADRGGHGRLEEGVGREAEGTPLLGQAMGQTHQLLCYRLLMMAPSMNVRQQLTLVLLEGNISSYFLCVQFCRLSAKPAEETACSPHCAGKSPFELVGAVEVSGWTPGPESGILLALPCPAGRSRLTGRAVASD